MYNYNSKNVNTYFIKDKSVYFTLLHMGGYENWDLMLREGCNYYFKGYWMNRKCTLCICSSKAKKDLADYTQTTYTVHTSRPDHVIDNGEVASIRGKYLLSYDHYLWGTDDEKNYGYYQDWDDMIFYEFKILDAMPDDFSAFEPCSGVRVMELWYPDENGKYVMKPISLDKTYDL